MKNNKEIYEPWYQRLTDDEIKNCKGDYIGCEICRNANKCINIKLRKLKEICKEYSMEVKE